MHASSPPVYPAPRAPCRIRPGRARGPVHLAGALALALGAAAAPAGPGPAVPEVVPVVVTAEIADEAPYRRVPTGGAEVPVDALRREGWTSIAVFVSRHGGGDIPELLPWVKGMASAAALTRIRVLEVDPPDATGQDLNTPVARQHGLTSLPAAIVWDSTGKELARGAEGIREVARRALLDGRTDGELAPVPAGTPAVRTLRVDGAAMDLAGLRVPGRFSILMLTARSAPASSMRQALVEKAARAREDVFAQVVMVEPRTGSWDGTPVVKQAGVERLPFTRIVGPGGEVIAEGREARTLLRRIYEETRERPRGAFAGARPAPPPSPRFKEVATRGEVIDLAELPAEGAFRVVVFSSPHAADDAAFRTYFGALAQYRPNVRVYWLDIDRPGATEPDLGSPLAKKYGVDTVPYVHVTGDRGQALGQGTKALEFLYQHILALPVSGLPPSSEMAWKRLETGGAAVESESQKVDGKFSVVLYCSELLESCRFLEPFLKRFAEHNDHVVARMVDMTPSGGDEQALWETAGMKQLGLPGLPFADIYGPEGTRFSTDDAALSLLQRQFQQTPPPEMGEGPFPVEVPLTEVPEITRGNPVDLREYVVKGKTTIIEFFSPFCGPCKKIKPVVEAIARERDDVVARLVNINRPGAWGIDGGSPVARQYGVMGVPYFMVFGPDGELRSRGNQAYQEVLVMGNNLWR